MAMFGPVSDLPDLTEVQRAQLAAGGPISVACDWRASAFEQHDLASAWPLMHADFRLAAAQSWLLRAGRGGDDEAAALIAVGEGPEWSSFSVETLERWLVDRSQFAEWGTLSYTETYPPNIEVVLFTPLADPSVGEHLEVDQVRVVQKVTMQLDVGQPWRVAAFGAARCVPGWPPREETLE